MDAAHLRHRLSARFSRPSWSGWGVFVLSLAADAVLLLHPGRPTALLADISVADPAYRVCVAAMPYLAASMLLTVWERSFRFFMGAHAALSFLILFFYALPPENVTLLLVANLLFLALFEKYPLNLVLNVLFSLPFIALFAFQTAFPVFRIVQLAVTAAAVAVLGSFMGRYREGYIAQHGYIGRLEDNVSTLTRANFLSQNYAKDVEAQSRTRERQRLTRDIHDMIGYTLTNSIMMFEAVKVMVKNDPERVADYAESARRNAEEGLGQIKGILRDLRTQEDGGESVYWAIKKLVQVFSLSTGVRVRFEFGNASTSDLDRFRDVVYHFIQEGLINAFRHGRAEKVVVMFWDYGNELRVSLDDNGVGCAETPKDGIGMAGMRERALLAGGRVAIDRTHGGFRVSLLLPKGGKVG